MSDITVALIPVAPVNVSVGVAALNVQVGEPLVNVSVSPPSSVSVQMGVAPVNIALSSQGIAGKQGIQGIEGIQGIQGIPGPPAGQVATWVFTQSQPASVWSIQHNLGRYPSVAVVDSTEREVIGDLQYLDSNNLTLTFSAPFSGEAYLN